MNEDSVTLPLARKFDTGDRVSVTVDDLTAYGVIGTMAYHWDTIKGRHIYPIILDGTGQTVEVAERRLAREKE